MRTERTACGLPRPPFPVYDCLVDDLLAAHPPCDDRSAESRSPLVAHVLATCAGYAYSDCDTMALIMTRMGLAAGACVQVAQTVDAMFIFSTAFLLQSRCGRVAILCFRGTEPGSLLNWVGDADVGAEGLTLAGASASLRVHAGFHRNLRAVRLGVMEELRLALEGRSLLDPQEKTAHPLQALYVTGHSLGGAMAALFALTLGDSGADKAASERLRAVYTFGQPLVVGGQLPPGAAGAAGVAHRLYRHVLARDPVPGLPPAGWGKLAHVGREYRHLGGGSWQAVDPGTAQLADLREIPRSLLAIFAAGKRRASLRYSMADHGPHEYLSALRPAARVTEFGDRDPDRLQQGDA